MKSLMTSLFWLTIVLCLINAEIENTLRNRFVTSSVTALDYGPLGEKGVFLYGAASQNRTGSVVCTAGDINGDDKDDFIIAANGYGDIILSGRVYLVYGSGWFTDPISLETIEDYGITITGDEKGNNAGLSCSTAGDVNNDGYADFLIGTPRWSDAGIVYLIYGGSALPSSIDLSSIEQYGVIIGGESAGDRLGTAVATAGDVNKDGYDDFLIGAPGYSSYTGRAYLIYGSETLPERIDLSDLGSIGRTITGASTSSSCGHAVSGAGDVNKDSYDDFLIGCYGSNSFTGQVFLIYGKASIETLQLSLFLNEGVKLSGATSNSRAGWAVCGGNDITGDGYADFLIAATGNGQKIGKVYLIYGGASLPSSLDLSELGYNGVTFTGDTETDLTGYSIACNHDINHDGRADILIASTGYSSSTGRVYVIYGSRTLDSMYLEPFGSTDITITGDSAGEHLAYSVAYAGDVNGDSYADVLISAVSSAGAAPKVTLLYGGNELQSFLALGSLETGVVMVGGDSDNAGYSIAAVGDFNKDGRPDLLIGAPLYESQTGRAFIVYGSDSHGSRFSLDSLYSSGLTQSWGEGVILTGETTGDRAGFSVSGVGDVNQDGYDDVLIAAPSYARNTGRVYLFYGSAGRQSPVTLDQADCVLTGSEAGDEAGMAVAGVGDVNGDHYPDFVILSTGIGTAFLIYGDDRLTDTILLSSDDSSIAAVIIGESAGDLISLTSVGAAGDINRDGYTEILLGASTLADSTGAAYLVYGGRDIRQTIYLEVLEEGGIKFGGAVAADELGAAVSTAGDVNHDGYDDLLIGAPGYNSETGIVYLIYGGPSLTTQQVVSVSELDETTGVKIHAEYSTDRLGSSVHAAGDLNNDGYDDFVIGAAGYSNKRGRAYILYGNGSLPKDLRLSELGTGGFTLSGESNSDVAGIAVSTAGDINRDGFSDVMIGVSGYLSGYGAVHLIYGKTNGAPMPSSAPTLSPTSYFPPTVPALPFTFPVAAIRGYGVTITGTVAGSYSGNGVAGLGDINGDGFDDFAINIYSDPTTELGKVYLYYGKAQLSSKALESSANVVITGEEVYDGFAVICSAGDLNHDGLSDVLFTAPSANNAAGRVYVLFGNRTLPHTISIGSLGLLGLAIDGESEGDQVGFSVAALGDFNRDGIDDIAIGANNANDYSGKVYILYGQTAFSFSRLSLSALGSAGVAISGESSSRAGATVAAADVNGDRHPDLLIGAPNYNNGRGRIYILYSPATALSSTGTLPEAVKDGKGLRVVASDYYSLGYRMTSIGDLNGDGYQDFMSFLSGFDSYGSIAVIFGGANLPDRISVNSLGSRGILIDSNAYQVSYSKTVGDFNHDGFDDLLIGTGDKSTPDYYYGGLAFLIFGRASLPTSLSLANLGEDGITFQGQAAYSALGQSVAFIGDVNHDTFMDILIGASGYASNKGRSYVIYGTNQIEHHEPTSQPSSAPSSAPTLPLGVLRFIFTSGALLSGRRVKNYFSGDYDGLLMNGAEIVDSFYPYQTEVLQLRASSQQYVKIDKQFRIGGKNGLTVSWWQRPATVDTTAKIFDFGNGEAADNFLCTVASTCQLYYGSEKKVAVDLPCECYKYPNTWCFLTLTLTYAPFNEATSTWTFYVNGSFYSQQENTFYPLEKEPTTAYLGRGLWDSDAYYDGLLGSFQLDNYVLTADEILASYELAPTSTPTPVPTAAPSVVPTVIPLVSLEPPALLSFTGEHPGDGSEIVSGVGDVNGDGYDDFLVGSQGWNNSQGRVLLFYGSSNPTSLMYTVQIIGQTAGDSTGVAVAGLGDINHDGYHDFLFSAGGALEDRAKVYLVYGAKDLPAMQALGALTVSHVAFHCSVELCGISIAAAGDVNRDGFPDLLIGAFNKAYLIYGSASLPASISLDDLSSTTGVTLSGIYSLGIKVASVGDVNNDGYDDILIAAPFTSELSYSGKVYLLFGSAGLASSINLPLLDTGCVTFKDLRSASLISLASAGDINKDGYDDILLAVPDDSSSVGVVYLIYGKQSLATTISLRSPASPGNVVLFYAERPRSYLGSALTAIGDVNHDNYTDFLIGASLYSSTNTGYSDDYFVDASTEGKVYVIYGSATYPSLVPLGALGKRGFSYLGEAVGSRLGSSLASAGDYNGDGIVDYLLGANGDTEDSGKVYLVFGSAPDPTSQPSSSPTIAPTREGEFTYVNYLYWLGGTGSGSYVSDGTSGRLATAAEILKPVGLGGDASGNVYVMEHVSDAYCRIRKIDTNGVIRTIVGPTTITRGEITGTIPSIFNYGWGLVVSTDGKVFQTSDGSVLGRYNQPTDSLRQLLTVNAARGIYQFQNRLYVADYGNNAVLVYGITAQTVEHSYSIDGPSAVWVDTTGLIYVTETNNHYIKTISTTGIITVFAGTGESSYNGDTTATECNLNSPVAIYGDASGRIYFSEHNACRLRVVANGRVTTIAGNGTCAVARVTEVAEQTVVGRINALWIDADNRIYLSEDEGFVRYIERQRFSQNPTSQPSNQPSRQPSSQPTGSPTKTPSGQPSAQPSNQPITLPTSPPTSQPSGSPTKTPSAQPSAQPSRQPTGQPSQQPSNQPSGSPTTTPTVQPSAQPSRQPNSKPSGQPTSQPSGSPTKNPSSRPSAQPSRQPTSQPSRLSTSQPSGSPTKATTVQPSAQPSGQPTSQPSRQPSRQPNGSPTNTPTSQPSRQPTSQPSGSPTKATTAQPSAQPSGQPTSQPSGQPSRQPNGSPTNTPTSQPSRQPSSQPNGFPTSQPTTQPSAQPAAAPTSQPSRQPSGQPSGSPTKNPSSRPSVQPSTQPTSQPSRQPTLQPSRSPTMTPTSQPSRQPSSQPSRFPTSRPTTQPSVKPAADPTSQPSGHPTCRPTTQPSAQPVGYPTSQPSGQPSSKPSVFPTKTPTTQPSSQPVADPTSQPSCQPSGQPSEFPTTQPTTQPSAQPVANPTSQPSRQPSSQPSGQPTCQPSSAPSVFFSVSLGSTTRFRSVPASSLFLADNVTGNSYLFGLSADIPSVLANVVLVESSLEAIVILKSDGSISAWGGAEDINGWQQYQSPGFNITTVISNEHAFCGLTATGRVIAFGSSDYGGVIPSKYVTKLSSNILNIVASAAAFCALKADGTVYCWGNQMVGGGVSSLTRTELVHIASLYSNRGAFVAMNRNNELFTWGSCAYGGCKQDVKNVLEVFTTKTVFLALLKTGKVMTWGNERFGGAPPDSIASVLTGSLKSIVSTTGAIAVILGNNSVVSWGHSRYGGDSSAVRSELKDITSLVASLRAFAALKSNGRVIVWGDTAYGGRLTAKLLNVQKVVASKGAFAALRNNGSVAVWGQSLDGGELTTSLQTLLKSNIVYLQGIENGFIAMKNDGNVIGWGNTLSFPVPGILTNIGADTVKRLAGIK